jgi:HEPN domain-containing protein
MKPSTREWVAKAEEDYLAALDLARRRKQPLWSGVCFHAQQSAEKYLKARLEEAGLPVPRTHDLDHILDRLLTVEPLWSDFRSRLQTLTDYAVDFRYPGQTANKSHARRALVDCRSVRREVRATLGLTD